MEAILHASVSAKQLHLEQRQPPPHLEALRQHYHPHPQRLPRPPLHWGDLGHQNLSYRSIKHWVGMQANHTGSRQSAEAQRSEMPGLSKSNVLDSMHLSREAGVIREVSN